MPGGTHFRACEADFPLRRGWFYHASEDGKTKSAAYLLQRYIETVGNGGTMNLGIAPTRDGRLSDEDVRALRGFGAMKTALFANEVTAEGEPFNVVVLEEDLAAGEQVDHWFLRGEKGSDGRRRYLADGRAIGRRRIRLLPCDNLPRAAELEITAAGPDVRPVRVRRYRADGELVRLVLSATSDSGETDTAKWMTRSGQ